MTTQANHIPKKQIYFNDVQQEAMYTAANTNIIIGGRRIGKTHGVVAPWLLRNVQQMPGSSGAIVAGTFQQAFTRTLPGTLKALELMGFKRDVHYYVGRKPPKSANFKKPIIEPVSYDHVVSWYNGSVQYIISQDVKGSSNSLTLHYLLGDEARFLDFDQLKDETFPANGGFKAHFSNCPWVHGMLFVSDMPQDKSGNWLLNYREKMDPELIEYIHALVCELFRLKQLPQTSYTQKMIREYSLSLTQLRQIAVYYREWSTIENIQVVGEKYIRQMKRDLPPLVFQTSVLCKRLGKLKDGFYPALNEKRHYYSAFDNSFLLSFGYDFKKAGEMDCRQDGDLDLDNPICIAFDYNANINWLVCGQKHGMKMRTLKSIFVKYNRKLRELVDDFCEYYRFHHSREVVYYFDNTALASNYAVNDEDFASVICNQFEKNGWTVYRQHIGNPVKHSEKYIMIDQALKGQKYLYPEFNQPNNEALLLAMQGAGVTINSRGFQKDKSGEKLAETEEDLLEYRTDGTDAWDTLWIGMNLYPYQNIKGNGIIILR